MTPPPLVLLHAFPVDARLFDPVRQALTAVESLRLLTPDFRGFGARAGEDLPDPPDLTVLADNVIADLDAEGVERVVLGGVSMGGYVALAVLRRHPERVAGLVLANTRAGADDEAAVERRHGVAERADRGDVADGFEAVKPLLAPDASDDVRASIAAVAADAQPASIAWAQRAMAGRSDSTELLRRTRVPVLVIVGEQDTVTPPDVAREMVGLVDDGELIVLPGAGHLTPAEQPTGFSSAVSEWFNRRFG